MNAAAQDGRAAQDSANSQAGRAAQDAAAVDRPIISASGLTKVYAAAGGWFSRARSEVRAVDGVSFAIRRGESFGLVGESGCGKTTTGKLLLRLTAPTAGAVVFDDGDGAPVDVAALRGGALKAFRRRAQMIFQDPYESMNPRRTIFDTVAEPLAVQKIGGRAERVERVERMLETVGLTPAPAYLFRYPHELSGGQRQRAAIARALVVEPSFVVADEPTSMLDASIRAGVTRLMRELGERMGLSYLYITHDLAAARYACDRIAVMYMGGIVEEGETERLLRAPSHPYTRALLSAVPVPDPLARRPPVQIRDAPAAPVSASTAASDPPQRCRFYDRCPIADEHCENSPPPPLRETSGGHLAACYKVGGG